MRFNDYANTRNFILKISLAFDSAQQVLQVWIRAERASKKNN